MRKYIFSVTILLLLNVVSFLYLENALSSLKAFPYKYTNKPIVYIKQAVKINDLANFNFNDYFDVLDFGLDSYKVYIDESQNLINIRLLNSDDVLSYEYKIIEPIVITETEYITQTVYVDNSEYADYEDNNIYYSIDYYEFELGTDLSYIIQIVQDDIVTYTNVTCDYSNLNPYENGEYSIYFYNDFQKITKIVKII